MAGSAVAANTYWGQGVEAVLPANAATRPGQDVSLNSISCPSTGNCSAVGSYPKGSADRDGGPLGDGSRGGPARECRYSQAERLSQLGFLRLGGKLQRRWHLPRQLERDGRAVVDKDSRQLVDRD